MSEQKYILEQYLKARFSDKPALTILRLDKIADGWESDNYVLTVEYGDVHRTREDWVWRIYSGAGNQEKAVLEFNSMQSYFQPVIPCRAFSCWRQITHPLTGLLSSWSTFRVR